MAFDAGNLVHVAKAPRALYPGDLLLVCGDDDRDTEARTGKSPGRMPIDNNWVENQIRPIALGRSNWLFAGSLRAGKRAAVVMSLLHLARINGHDPYAYLRDVLERLPLQPASRIDELLPHRWTNAAATAQDLAHSSPQA